MSPISAHTLIVSLCFSSGYNLSTQIPVLLEPEEYFPSDSEWMCLCNPKAALIVAFEAHCLLCL